VDHAQSSTLTTSEKLIAGVDEAGRGPLAGPVVAAAVILDAANPIEGLRDSKSLSAKRREILAEEIWNSALSVGIGTVHEQVIDEVNILQATYEAMRQAVHSLDTMPAKLLVDGNRTIPDLKINQQAIIKGDASEAAISAASIIAKTSRDAMMCSYALLFPEYGFEGHKGYGSERHMAALEKYGRSLIHRRSFHPVDKTSNLLYRYHGKPSAHGRMGEIIAGMYLVREGYRLMAHSYHAGRSGEIDLVAMKEGEISFVEVESISDPNGDEMAVQRLDPTKQKQVISVAERYLQDEYKEEVDCQFDLITVNFAFDKPRIVHYKEAFSAY